MDHISPSQILDRANCLDKEIPENSYHKSYIHFVNYFSARDEISEADLIIGSNFTYGWMPTILNYKSNDFAEAIKTLNHAKKPERISDDELSVLKRLINNSLVGTSKLLHFINPDVYAIWDSHVCRCLHGKSAPQKINCVDTYWLYLDLCKKTATEESLQSQFQGIHKSFIDRIGYEVSPNRIIELIMFINGKEIQNREKDKKLLK
mgnify:FL=1